MVSMTSCWHYVRRQLHTRRPTRASQPRVTTEPSVRQWKPPIRAHVLRASWATIVKQLNRRAWETLAKMVAHAAVMMVLPTRAHVLGA